MLFTSDHHFPCWPLLPIQIQRKQFYFQCSYPAATEHNHGNLLFPIRNISTFKVHFLATLRLPEGSPSRSVGCQSRLEAHYYQYVPGYGYFYVHGPQPEKKKTNHRGPVWVGERSFLSCHSYHFIGRNWCFFFFRFCLLLLFLKSLLLLKLVSFLLSLSLFIVMNALTVVR